MHPSVKKLLLILLMCCLFLGVSSFRGQAEEKTDLKLDGYTYINPLYEGIFTEKDLKDPDPHEAPKTLSYDGQYYDNVEEAAAVLRQGMVSRQDSITVPYAVEAADDAEAVSKLQQTQQDIRQEALVHTGQPKEGDYLRWHYGGYKCPAAGISYEGSRYTINFVYNFTYYTTAEQEAELDDAVSTLLDSLDLEEKGRYEKIKSIYDYICANVVYDHEHGSDYDLKYTAYAALINKTAVCQGYSSLLYRLLLSQGIDSRLIAGYAGEAHGWNIVKINDLYYNLDSTWDAGQSDYTWFLKCMDNFPNHSRYDEYNTAAFHEVYPMDAKDFRISASSLEIEDVVYDEGNASMTSNWKPYYPAGPVSLTVTMNDGTVISGNGIYDITREINERFGLSYEVSLDVDDQSDENIWGAGKHPMTCVLGPAVDSYDVFINETPLASLYVRDVTRPQGSGTVMEEEIDGEVIEWMRYDPTPQYIEVTLKDGTVFSGAWDDVVDQISEACGIYYQNVFNLNTQNAKNPFVPGENRVSFIFGPLTADYLFILEDNPILSVKPEDITVYEGTEMVMGEGEDAWRIFPVYPKELTVETIKGTFSGKTSDVMNDIREAFGESFSIKTHDDQSKENQWEVGSTYEARIEMGQVMSEPFSVTVKGNPILSVSANDVTKRVPEYAEERSMPVIDEETGLSHVVTFAFYDTLENVKVVTDKGSFEGEATEVKKQVDEAYGVRFNCDLSSGENMQYDYVQKNKKGIEPGDYELEFSIGGISSKYTFHLTEDPVSEVVRLSGKLRYDTAIKAADELKSVLGVDKFDTVILATGENFADALGGGYLAAKKSAPILLTKESQKNKAIDYIRDNVTEGGTVYILGGEGAVPSSCLEGLGAYHLVRLSGKTRYDTNLAILNEAGVSNEEILIASGENFADALAASASGRPILLTKGGNTALSEKQKTFLLEHTSNAFYIIGGTGVVSQGIEEDIASVHAVNRIKGANRYQTSVEIAKTFFSSPDKAILVYSDKYPDGLCAGPLGYVLKAPILLVKTDKEDSARAYCIEGNITSGLICGGEAAVTDDSARKIFSMSEDQEIVKR